MGKRKDLNGAFSAAAKRMRIKGVATESVVVIFDKIEETVLRELGDVKCRNVLVMGPYFSNDKILKLLLEKDRVSIITTNERMLKSKSRAAKLRELTPFAEHAVKTLSAGRGKNRSILHTKAIILLDEWSKPYKVLSGSFNWTNAASDNIENMTIFTDPLVVSGYKREWHRVWKHSSARKSR